jgi:hypothetical protein
MSNATAVQSQLDQSKTAASTTGTGETIICRRQKATQAGPLLCECLATLAGAGPTHPPTCGKEAQEADHMISQGWRQPQQEVLEEAVVHGVLQETSHVANSVKPTADFALHS